MNDVVQIGSRIFRSVCGTMRNTLEASWAYTIVAAPAISAPATHVVNHRFIMLHPVSKKSEKNHSSPAPFDHANYLQIATIESFLLSERTNRANAWDAHAHGQVR